MSYKSSLYFQICFYPWFDGGFYFTGPHGPMPRMMRVSVGVIDFRIWWDNRASYKAAETIQTQPNAVMENFAFKTEESMNRFDSPEESYKHWRSIRIERKEIESFCRQVLALCDAEFHEEQTAGLPMSDTAMNPHPFNMGGSAGLAFPSLELSTPDRPCMICGLPDRDPIHYINPPFDHGTIRTTWVRCGNCKKQYEIPVEQPFRYHAVQQHKFACPAGSKEAVEAQHEALVRDFAAQETRRQVTRPWWKFWRRS